MKLLQAKRVSGTKSFWHVSAVMNGLPDISSVKRHGLLPGTIPVSYTHLSTTFVSEQDEFAVVDFMPCYELYDNKEYYRPAEVYRCLLYTSARGMSEETVKAIVDKAVEKPFMGIFGTEKVNVLKLNAALEKAK